MKENGKSAQGDLVAEKEFLSFKEAAIYLGLSESYLYKLTSRGAVPSYCPGGKKLYFKREELNEWITGLWASRGAGNEDEKPDLG